MMIDFSTVDHPEQLAAIVAGWRDQKLRALLCSQVDPSDIVGPDAALFNAMYASPSGFEYIGVLPSLPPKAQARLRDGQALVQGGTTAEEFQKWLDKIRDDSAYRRLKAELAKSIQQIDDRGRGDTPDKSIAALINSIVGIRDRRAADSGSMLSEVVGAVLDKEKRWAGGEIFVGGVPVGVGTLDRRTGGLRRKQVAVLGGVPGVGKTSLAIQWLRNVALRIKAERRDAVAIMFSLEMGRDELLERMAQQTSGKSTSKVRNRDYPKDDESDGPDYREWRKAVQSCGGLPIYIEDAPGLDMAQMLRRALVTAAEFKDGVDLIVVDYLELGGETSENEVKRIGNIMRGAKVMARTLDCPVLLLAQLSRAVEGAGRGDRKPQLSDLRYGRDIEAIAKAVFFIYRPDVYQQSVNGRVTYQTDALKREAAKLEEFGGNCMIMVAKNTYGRPRTACVMEFEAEYTRFRELADADDKEAKVVPDPNRAIKERGRAKEKAA